MINQLKLLKEIENCTGSGSEKDKIKIINDNKDDEILRFFYQVAFNPFFTTKISKIDERNLYISNCVKDENQLFLDFKNLMQIFYNKKALNDEDRLKVYEFLSNFYKLILSKNEDVKLFDLLIDIIIKDLSISVQAKTINKGLEENYIPVPEVMKATELNVSDKLHWIPNVEYFYGELKYDGVRVLAFYQPDKSSFLFFTRNFNQIPNEYLEEIEKELLLLVEKIDIFDKNIFLDGELTDVNRQNVTGKLNKMLKGKLSVEESDDLLFNVFDVEKSHVYKSKNGNIKYEDRRNILYNAFDENYKKILLSEIYYFNTLDDATNKFNEVLKKNEEGIILKHPYHLYEVKKSKNWLKLKAVLDCDLKIYDYIEGKGKREGYIGSLCLTDSTNTLKVDVGSGFSDDDLEILNEKLKSGDLINKIVKVSYNQRIKDKHNNESLFLPRFIEFRLDKDESDNIKNIK